MAPKTYRVSIYPLAQGPADYIGNIMSQSLDSHVINGLVLAYTGAKPVSDSYPRFNAYFSDRYTSFLTKEGKQVYTNLPVIIEEE